MKKTIVLALVTLMAAAFSYAQEASRVGTVNMERLMNDYVGYQSALKRVEGAAQTARQHEEHHDGAVNRHKGEVSIPVQDTAWCPLAEEGLEDTEGLTRPTELELSLIHI